MPYMITDHVVDVVEDVDENNDHYDVDHDDKDVYNYNDKDENDDVDDDADDNDAHDADNYDFFSYSFCRCAHSFIFWKSVTRIGLQYFLC